MTTNLRRRLRHRFGGRDWLEGFVTAIGVVFFLIAALCAYALGVLVLHVRDTDASFPAGLSFMKGTKVFGFIFFLIMGFVSVAVGWNLAGRSIRGVRRRRGRAPRS